MVRQFLAWAQQAGAETRAEAASALARAFLHSELDPPLRDEAAECLSALIDDPCAEVRRALAEAISGARNAPRHLVDEGLALRVEPEDGRRAHGSRSSTRPIRPAGGVRLVFRRPAR